MTKLETYSYVIKQFWNWAFENGFTFVPVPRIVKATGACEDIDTLWGVKSPNVRTTVSSGPRTSVTSIDEFFFAQTGQLYLEQKLGEKDKLFTFGSSGRAEPVVDHRHLREFTLFECEGLGSWGDFTGIVQSVFRTVGIDLSITTYAECIDFLNGSNPSPYIKTWGEDFSHADEIQLAKEYGPFLLCNHPDPQPPEGRAPKLEKFFNMKPYSKEQTHGWVVQSADVILPYSGESMGGAVREHHSEILKSRLDKSNMMKMLRARGIEINTFDEYLSNMKKHNIGEHFGFGIGVDRVVQYLMKSKDIRDSAGFLVK